MIGRAQAVFWALGAAGGLILYAAALVHGGAGVVADPLALGWSAITGGLAAAKLMLGLRLDRRRSKRAWCAVIAIEFAMTGFGVLWLAIPHSMPAGSRTGVAGPGHATAAQVVLDLLVHAVIPDR